MPMKTKVFYMEIPEGEELSALYPDAREREISAVKNEQLKRQKYYAWQLLRYAYTVCGIDFYSLNFKKNENGKWTSDKLYFSLSHTEGAVAVALSDSPVGVDVEIVSSRAKRVAKKVFSPSELSCALTFADDEAELYTTRLWTKKESIFKTLDMRVFSPQSIDIFQYETNSVDIELSGKKYVISVCCDGAENAEFMGK